MLFISGQVGAEPSGELANDFSGQCEQAMDNVEALLAAAGMAHGDLAKITYVVTRAENISLLGEIRRRRWGSANPPAVTVLVVVAALARPDCLIEIRPLPPSSGRCAAVSWPPSRVGHHIRGKAIGGHAARRRQRLCQ